ncbi:MAG: LacI family DNA-binding transcriptional regulator [Lachnospirales bacterium]
MDITIKDIASIAGVSVSTVSRVINNTGYFSESSRQKVMKVVRDYNFTPNTSARNLKVAETKNIALLIKGITNPFFNKMLKVIEEQIAIRGYSLSILNVDDNINEIDLAIREVRDKNLCGVVFMGGSFGCVEERFHQLKVPSVLITVSAAEDISKDLYASVKIDDFRGGFMATEYLISLGHREIGFVFGQLDVNTPNGQRFLGYKEALKKYGIEYDPELVADSVNINLNSGYLAGFNSMKQILNRKPNVTGVVAFADILALGAMKAIFSAGAKVPEDISVVGFDGIEAGEFYQPSLDTIYQPANEMAFSGIELLFDMLQGGKTKHLVYDSTLLKRGSCTIKK